MSSTKRAVLIAKDCRHFSLQQQSFGSLNRHDNQYNSINLNKFGPAKTLQFDSSISSSASNNNNKNQSNINGFQNPSGFVKVNDYETTKKDVLCQKRFSTNNLYPLLQKEEKEWKNKTDFGDKNLSKSTLSLHIEAYENNNAIKAQNNNTGTKIFVDCDDLKASKKDQWVIPRQQPKEEEELMEAEVMAFKFSNKLMNFNGIKAIVRYLRHVSRKYDPINRENSVMVKNLSWLSSPSQIQEYFNKYGEVKYVNLPFDDIQGIYKGYGFVEFLKKTSAQDAVDDLQRPKLDGNILYVSKSHLTPPLKEENDN